ncbi:MAG: AI-2E family transporter, partial [Prevotellaceae bacterium]|nr:AI-2E family transporter [Prevotellaceae bacterium]
MQKEITFSTFIRWTGIILLVIAVLFALNYLSDVLMPFFVAWLLAYLLYPIVKFIENRLHIRFRPVSIILTLLFVGTILGLIGYLIVPPMIEQFQRLYDILIHWVREAGHNNNISTWISNKIIENQEQITAFFKSRDFAETLKTTAPKLFSVIGQTASILLSIVASMITLLYMFFILLDYETLTQSWIKIFPKKARPFWRDLATDVERELNNYIRGQGGVALCMAIMFCIGFSIIDFPMAIGLGILIGIMDLIPYLHTFALIPTAFLAMLKAANTGQSFWVIFGMAFAVFAVVQIISDMIVTPKIMGKAMGLNPAILLLSLSVWGSLLGFIGLI